MGWTVLDNAMVMHSDLDIVRLLLRHGEAPNLPEQNGANPPLAFAQRTERSDLAALLRHYGARK
jgi:ankyrin repeat protein